MSEVDETGTIPIHIDASYVDFGHTVCGWLCPLTEPGLDVLIEFVKASEIGSNTNVPG